MATADALVFDRDTGVLLLWAAFHLRGLSRSFRAGTSRSHHCAPFRCADTGRYSDPSLGSCTEVSGRAASRSPTRGRSRTAAGRTADLEFLSAAMRMAVMIVDTVPEF